MDEEILIKMLHFEMQQGVDKQSTLKKKLKYMYTDVIIKIPVLRFE